MHRSWIIKDNAGAECNSSCIVPLSIQLYAAKGTAPRQPLFLYTPTYIYIAEWHAIALMVYQFGSIFTGNPNVFGLIAAFAVLAVIVYMMFIKRCSEANKPTKSVKASNKRL